MNEAEFETLLSELLVEENDAQTRTFEEAGLLTGNSGLVVQLADGSEFQVTVVRSN